MLSKVMFADDTKICHLITSPINYDIDINSALQWCDVWLSFLNSFKYHHNSIGSSRSIRQHYFYSSDDNGEDITYPITTVSNEQTYFHL